METNEKSELFRNVATILRAIIEEHMYSQKCADCGADDPFFEDSCNYVALVASLLDFARYLEKKVRYEEILNK